MTSLPDVDTASATNSIYVTYEEQRQQVVLGRLTIT